MFTINQIADYLIHRVHETGGSLSLLKLQKLLYYIKAWDLAFDGDGIFPEGFQAWVHGPVNREIYDRFNESKMLFSTIEYDDISAEFDISIYDQKIVEHIDNVLESYMEYSGTQLEAMSHQEDPWIIARGDLSPAERSEEFIDENLMRDFYKARIK